MTRLSYPMPIGHSPRMPAPLPVSRKLLTSGAAAPMLRPMESLNFLNIRLDARADG